VPCVLIVCTRDIEIGDELLLDYGDGYNTIYLLNSPHPKHSAEAMKQSPSAILSLEMVRRALPGYGSDSSRDSSPLTSRSNRSI
jgi:hypothetical protein